MFIILLLVQLIKPSLPYYLAISTLLPFFLEYVNDITIEADLCLLNILCCPTALPWNMRFLVRLLQWFDAIQCFPLNDQIVLFKKKLQTQSGICWNNSFGNGAALFSIHVF